MNNRPTPETDAFSGKLEDWINFAEKLERERDEALKYLKWIHDLAESQRKWAFRNIAKEGLLMKWEGAK